jgi:hypothetical protein
MKGERKLRLVAGGKVSHDEATEPPVTDEERAAADTLREALDGGPRPSRLARELRAAYVPAPLDPADLDALVARALGDESAATAAERAAAERLRADLAGETGLDGGSGEADLLRSLKVAARPNAIPTARNEALLAAAFSAISRRSTTGALPRRIPPAIMVTLTSVAALAAGLALFLGRGGAPPSTSIALVPARSSEDLFDAATPFPRRGEESARIDRIAAARTADLRNNRFAAWGVK